MYQTKGTFFSYYFSHIRYDAKSPATFSYEAVPSSANEGALKTTSPFHDRRGLRGEFGAGTSSRRIFDICSCRHAVLLEPCADVYCCVLAADESVTQQASLLRGKLPLLADSSLGNRIPSSPPQTRVPCLAEGGLLGTVSIGQSGSLAACRVCCSLAVSLRFSISEPAHTRSLTHQYRMSGTSAPHIGDAANS